MYRRPKFLEKLHDIRCEMAAEADYDVQLFTELVRHDVTLPVSEDQHPKNTQDDGVNERFVASHNA